MNLPNFKTILQKLSVFKNNVPLLVAVILAVVAGLLFIPTQLMSSGLKERIQQESVTNGAKKIAGLMTTAVPPEQYKKEEDLQKAHAKDANAVDLLAEETTQRELLSYDIFPTPDPNAGFSSMIFQVFGQRYRSGIDALIARVDGRDCPATAEIQRGLEDASSSMRSVRSGPSSMMDEYAMTRSPRGALGGLYGGSMMGMGSVQRMIVDEMCLDRAKSMSVYVNPLDIAGYDYWGNYTYDVNMADAVKDCWYHQLGYWVIEDIFKTIGTMNSGHESVLTAPVKRFLSLTFTMGLKRPRSGGGVFRSRGFRDRKATQQGQKKEIADKPLYVLSESDGLTEPCTGRFSKQDGDIDVIHFNADFVVSARDVLAFMEELCSGKEHQFKGYPKGQDPPQTFKHNQITILESSMKSPSLTDMSHRYYRYGEDNVVELNLICEYIFNKKGYEPIKPESVKKTLAGGDQAAKK
jgi:hypothetical protein